MAATEEMVEIACRLKPHGVCIVPERRAEITTEGGLDVAGQHNTLAPFVRRLNDAGIVVSLFIDPDEAQLRAASLIRAGVVELHTGAYANGKPGELERLTAAAALTDELGLECHAGHGLTYENVTPIAALPQVVELNIGHYLIGEALLVGLPAAILEMKRLMDAARTVPG
jgi:pyridoxine 5-phosphate synthase